MAKVKRIIGAKLGKWTILKKVHNTKNQTAYLCKCDCGNERTILSGNLGRSSKSCGCTNKLLEPFRIQANYVWRQYHANARTRKIEFSLSYDFWYTLTQSPCFYCGTKFSNCCRPNDRNNKRAKPFFYNGIDRIDSTIGYTENNCVSCCRTCNIAKSNNTKDYFLEWIYRVYTYNAARLTAYTGI